MSEPKRPVQLSLRSASPEGYGVEPELRDGSNPGRESTDLYMGNSDAEATPIAMQRLIGMLSSIRGAARNSNATA